MDKIWNAFWSGGISDSLRVIEQISVLLFIKQLDDLHTAREKQANRLGTPIKEPIFAAGQAHLRWSRFREFEAEKMFRVVSQEVFPFIKNLHGGLDTAVEQQLELISGGAVMPGINVAKLKYLEVLVPSIETQREYTRRADAIKKLKNSHNDSLVEFDTLFNSILQRAFKGDL